MTSRTKRLENASRSESHNVDADDHEDIWTRGQTEANESDLIEYLLAAKRSLQTIKHVSNATEVCSRMRHAFIEMTIVDARTRFIQDQVVHQCDILMTLKTTIAAAILTLREDMSAQLSQQRKAQEDLDLILASLKAVIVDKQIRPDLEESRTLLSFVDEAGIAELRAKARLHAKESIEQVDDELAQIETTWSIITQARHRLGKPREDKSRSTTQPDLELILTKAEDETAAMAVNLQSLVKHFDVCVTAVKSLDGGGDMAAQLTFDMPEGVDLEDQRSRQPTPSSGAEFADLVALLRTDALQVEDVVREIETAARLVQQQCEFVETLQNSVVEEFQIVLSVYKDVVKSDQKILAAARRYQELQSRIGSKCQEMAQFVLNLEDASVLYRGYLRAFDCLLIEIGRRMDTRLRREALLHDTMAKLDDMYEEELQHRQLFQDEHGEFLPMDIWPGLTNLPSRLVIAPGAATEEHIPQLSRSTIRKAIRRVHGSTSDSDISSTQPV